MQLARDVHTFFEKFHVLSLRKRKTPTLKSVCSGHGLAIIVYPPLVLGPVVAVSREMK